MQKDNRIRARWLIPVLVVVVLVLTAVVWMLGGDDSFTAMLTRPTRPPDAAQTGQNTPNTGGQLQPLPDQTDPLPSLPPGAESDPTDESPGGESGGDPDGDWPPQTDPPGTEPPVTTARPTQSGPEDIRVRQYARFSGQYVEDGRDELVENVAAILVTNSSDQFLDLATLTYDIDGEDAVFVVTGLPAGSSAWVMESSRRVIPDDAAFTFLECVTAFRSNAAADTSQVSIYADANMLTAVNNTDRTLENVFVYYKTLHSDGNFFGGITYRVDFGTLEPGGSAQSLAGHYSGDDTRIVRIGWADQ